MRYINVDFIGPKHDDETIPDWEESVVIDMNGVSFGDHFVNGFLVHYLKKKGDLNTLWEKMEKSRVTILIDNIMKANSDDLLSPGILLKLGAEAESIIREFPAWKIVFIDSIPIYDRK